MQDFEALHGTELLASDKVLEAKLSKLICAPGVEKTQDLSLANSTHFLSEELRIRSKVLLPSLVCRLVSAASIRVLAELVVRESYRGVTRTNNLLILVEYHFLDCL